MPKQNNFEQWGHAGEMQFPPKGSVQGRGSRRSPAGRVFGTENEAIMTMRDNWSNGDDGFMRKREPTNPERTRDGRKRQAYKTARTGAKRRTRAGRDIISLSGKSGPENGRKLERTSGKQGKMRVQRRRKGRRHDGRKALEPANQAFDAAEDVGQTSCKRRHLYDKMIS